MKNGITFAFKCPHCFEKQTITEFKGDMVQSYVNKTINSGTIQCQSCNKQTYVKIAVVLDPLFR